MKNLFLRGLLILLLTASTGIASAQKGNQCKYEVENFVEVIVKHTRALWRMRDLFIYAALQDYLHSKQKKERVANREKVRKLTMGLLSHIQKDSLASLRKEFISRIAKNCKETSYVLFVFGALHKMHLKYAQGAYKALCLRAEYQKHIFGYGKIVPEYSCSQGELKNNNGKEL